MGELNDCFHPWRMLHYSSITKRPMFPASRAGTCGPDPPSPENDCDKVPEDDPCEAGQCGRGASLNSRRGKVSRIHGVSSVLHTILEQSSSLLGSALMFWVRICSERLL